MVYFEVSTNVCNELLFILESIDKSKYVCSKNWILWPLETAGDLLLKWEFWLICCIFVFFTITLLSISLKQWSCINGVSSVRTGVNIARHDGVLEDIVAICFKFTALKSQQLSIRLKKSIEDISLLSSPHSIS